MSLLLSIDPGNEQSGWLLYDGVAPLDFGIWPNADLRELLHNPEPRFGRVPDLLAIEFVQSFGMAVGASVFETCFEAGRMVEAWGDQWEHRKVYRKDVKLHLCGTTRAKDANVRQALIDRFGGSREKAIGLKKSPGPLYGIKSHIWSSLAIAVYAAEVNE